MTSIDKTCAELIVAAQQRNEAKLQRETNSLLDDCIDAINLAVKLSYERQAQTTYWQPNHAFAEQVVTNVQNLLIDRGFFVQTHRDCNGVIVIMISLDAFPVKISMWTRIINWFKSLHHGTDSNE